MRKIRNIKYSKANLKKLVYLPSENTNKYSRGRCCIVAGSNTFPGAAILASRAAQKSGAGYTKLYTVKENVVYSAVSMPSIPVDSFSNFKVESKFDKNKPLAYVIGPGFKLKDKNMTDLFCNLLVKAECPVIVDGGALSLFDFDEVREALNIRSDRQYSTILTPHTGEAKKLIYNYVIKSYKDNRSLAIDLANYTKATILLKDSNSYVCSCSKLYKMKFGTPALAKAGSGDVLAGILGGIVCQNKLSDFDACVLASNIHALSGKLSEKEHTSISVTPEDLIGNIGHSFKQLI